MPAPRENLKVTTPRDLRVAELLLQSPLSATDYHLHLRPDERGHRRPSATSPPPTPSATARRPSERGIAELGVSEHVHRFTRRSTSGSTRSGAQSAVDDLDAYCEFVREETDLRLGIEADFVPGPRGPDGRTCSTAATGTTSSARCTSSATQAVDHEATGHLGPRRASPDKVWRRYFETLGEAARSGLFDILAHPDLVKVWGAERPRPEGDLRRFYEPRHGGDRRGAASRSRSRPPGCASRSASSTRRRRSWRCASTPGARSRCRATPTCPRTSAAATTQALELLAEHGRDASCASSSGRDAPAIGADRMRAWRRATGIG